MPNAHESVPPSNQNVVAAPLVERLESKDEVKKMGVVVCMGGELSKRQRCFSTGDYSVHSLSTDFRGSYHGFTLIQLKSSYVYWILVLKSVFEVSLISRGWFWRRGGARTPSKPLIPRPLLYVPNG